MFVATNICRDKRRFFVFVLFFVVAKIILVAAASNDMGKHQAYAGISPKLNF